MPYAVLVKWDKSIHGALNGEPEKYLSTKYLVLDTYYTNNRKEEFINLILSGDYESKYSSTIICHVKSNYLYLNRCFANINYTFLNFIKKLKKRYIRKILIKNDPWSFKFREFRGRFPNYIEYTNNRFN